MSSLVERVVSLLAISSRGMVFRPGAESELDGLLIELAKLPKRRARHELIETLKLAVVFEDQHLDGARAILIAAVGRCPVALELLGGDGEELASFSGTSAQKDAPHVEARSPEGALKLRNLIRPGDMEARRARALVSAKGA